MKTKGEQERVALTKLQLGCGQRVRMRVYPTLVFCENSPDLLDSKGVEFLRNDKKFVPV
jgi:hypothetical protein